MAKLNYLSTGYTITDETVSRTSSTALRIGHDLIKATGFEIWTGSGKTGTQLTLTTDYVLSAEATDYTTKVGSTIYTKLAIVNGAYLNTTLYISYVTVGDYASVENVKELSWKTIKTAAQWTSDNTILGLGETGRETDTGREKTGDGVTAWNTLNYCLAPLSSTPSAGKVMVWPSQSENANANVVYRKVTGTIPSTPGGSITVSIPNASSASFAFGKIMTGTDSLPFSYIGSDGGMGSFVGGYIYASVGAFVAVTSTTATSSVLSKPFEAYIAYTE